jgi:hypothetical protein
MMIIQGGGVEGGFVGIWEAILGTYYNTHVLVDLVVDRKQSNKSSLVWLMISYLMDQMQEMTGSLFPSLLQNSASLS